MGDAQWTDDARKRQTIEEMEYILCDNTHISAGRKLVQELIIQDCCRDDACYQYAVRAGDQEDAQVLCEARHSRLSPVRGT